MKKNVFFIFVLLLSACSPQMTVNSQVTVTLPPSPTTIPTQTSQPLSQAFIDTQEQIAQSDIYTLTPLAIEMKNEDGTTPVPNIKPNATADELTFTITHEGKEFITKFDAINGKTITFKDSENRTWVWDGEKLAQGVIFPPEMTEKYTNQFKTFEYGVKQVDGVDTNVIYGIREDTTKKVVAMEVKIDGRMRMTRVGETIVEDKNGNEHSFYVYLHPDHNIGGRVAVTDKTADILFESEPESKRDISFFISIGKQLGMTPEQVKDWVFANGGIVNFKVAVGIPDSPVKYPVKFEDLPYKADFNKPVEIIAIWSQTEYDALSQEIKNNLTQLNRDFISDGYDYISGQLLWTKPNGQIQIISVETGIEITPWIITAPESGEDKYVIEAIRQRTGLSILRSVDLPGYISLGGDALSKRTFMSLPLYDNQARPLFEYSVIRE